MNPIRERGVAVPTLLGAAALCAILIVASSGIVTDDSEASMRIAPKAVSVITGNIVTMDIVVDATAPVNVFSGDVSFDPNILTVHRIDYNTSIADLWVERPWYDNGAGTLNFGGGTTKPGGFVGSGSLITIEFKTLMPGDGMVTVQNARILRHDGLGTDVSLTDPIDALITVLDTPPEPETAMHILVTDIPPSTDLNGDGRQTFADVSILILNLFGTNPRYDLNQDGSIDRADLEMVRNAR
jgi:hypothetical protein